MAFENTKKALNKVGEEYVKDIRDILATKNKNASGDLSRSVKYSVIENGSKFELELEANSYIFFVAYGRLPGGKPPPISAIRQWVNEKSGLNIPSNMTKEQYAWAIRTNIAKYGFEGVPELQPLIRSFHKEDALKYIKDGFVFDMKEYLKTIVRK